LATYGQNKTAANTAFYLLGRKEVWEQLFAVQLQFGLDGNLSAFYRNFNIINVKQQRSGSDPAMNAPTN